ncbi:hypothetical protein N178_25420 [Priestia aryabhattai B8W22]|nr:hypothetical protein N178_25420 [Priestia aryabhattai B8W22]
MWVALFWNYLLSEHKPCRLQKPVRQNAELAAGKKKTGLGRFSNRQADLLVHIGFASYRNQYIACFLACRLGRIKQLPGSQSQSPDTHPAPAETAQHGRSTGQQERITARQGQRASDHTAHAQTRRLDAVPQITGA